MDVCACGWGAAEDQRLDYLMNDQRSLAGNFFQVQEQGSNFKSTLGLVMLHWKCWSILECLDFASDRSSKIQNCSGSLLIYNSFSGNNTFQPSFPRSAKTYVIHTFKTLVLLLLYHLILCWVKLNELKSSFEAVGRWRRRLEIEMAQP
jgi:hypothetical protein